ncbi:hypothetical protein SISSUDRAFT_1071582 [Sistotremastrum suecicum HHB10207 ss-3]|uniref:RBR-type E3 ubiquitin transferase n=1 Tax=Sistotremastrum suecicum HHB10207 ss-3 TaxID=1314776 RepID=A0A166BFB4_9AGAM|nr:hypothetical protein SISSUDRAFT_1071582 [Sistotremastrum suecicum HHB10207 ss-3]
MDAESQALNLERRSLEKFIQETFRCDICMEELPKDDVVRIGECGHETCRECMMGYVGSKLGEHRFPVLCPICVGKGGEPSRVERDVVDMLDLTQAQMDLWIELEMSQFSILLDCRKCNRSTFADASDHAEMKILGCPLPNCDHIWCKECQQTVEPGVNHSCDGSLEMGELMKARGWKHCPGCQTPVEKITGCNHMTCSTVGCNTHFCYVCGESIVRSAQRNEIQSAVSSHYSRCVLFEH